MSSVENLEAGRIYISFIVLFARRWGHFPCCRFALNTAQIALRDAAKQTFPSQYLSVNASDVSILSPFNRPGR